MRRQSAFARRAGREGDEFQFWLGLGATIAGIGYLQHQELGPRDVVLVFTHDPKFDEPALSAALDTGAGYVGALGSRRTQERRVERLRDAGLDERAIARIHAPCGLDVGARTPSETAVSILAEVIAVRTGRTGERLRDTSGPIHPSESASAAGGSTPSESVK